MKTIINSDLIKKENRFRILTLLYKEQLTRSELSLKTGLTRAAISIITDDLLSNNIILEGEKNNSTGGRKGTTLLLNKEYGVIGSIYMDRDKFQVGIMNLSREIINQENGIVDKDNPTNTINSIITLLKSLLGNNKLLSIGIAVPGPIDKDKGMLGNITNFEKYSYLNIKEIFLNSFNVPIYIDNISNALLKAEYIKGNLQNSKVLELIIDSGFGSSVGKITDNLEITECELGHTTINIYGNKCKCGNVGCAELYVNQNEYLNNKENFLLSLKSVILNSINAFNVSNIIIFFKQCESIDNLISSLSLKLNYLSKNIIITKSILNDEYTFIAGNLAVNCAINEII